MTNADATSKLSNTGDHAMPRRAKEEMRRESPDGMPPQQRTRGVSRAVLLTTMLVAAFIAIVAVSILADMPEGILLLGGIILLIGLIGGLPAIFAGMLRWRERRKAESNARH